MNQSIFGRSRVRFSLAVLFFVAGFAAQKTRAQEKEQAGGQFPADTTRPVFQLGEVEVVARRIPLAQRLTDALPAHRLDEMGRTSLADALPLAAGVTAAPLGPRNEAGLRVRGFDLRRVPVYLDGVPIYVPYDGYADLARLQTFGASRVRVAKGFSSVLYGPNALGGAVNVITRKPDAPLEGRMRAGLMSGDGRLGQLSMGTRQEHFYAQANGSYVRRSTFPLPGGGRRVNARSEDAMLSGKVGYASRDVQAGDEYALGFAVRRGEKGNPPYVGSNSDVRPRYWRWPYWNQETIYALARERFAGGLVARGRLYVDHFENALFSYDDEAYDTQETRRAFRSFYDDRAFGGGLELSTPLAGVFTPTVALHVRTDAHRERSGEETLGRFRDVTWSAALEDDIQLTRRLQMTAGLSANGRRTLKAQSFAPEETYPKRSNRALGAQAALRYALSKTGGSAVSASIARKTRFPTIKDRYSYRLGRALPNPALGPERALHLETGYRGRFLEGRLRGRASLFYSLVTDVIQRVTARDPATGEDLFQLQNAGRARRAGAEASVQLMLPGGLEGGASYSYLHAENLTRPRLRFTHAPVHSGRFSLEATPLSGLSLRGQVAFRDDRYSRVQGLGLTPVAGFWRADVQGTYEIASGMSVEAGARNVFDRRYALSAGYPEPGRSFFLRFAYRYH